MKLMHKYLIIALMLICAVATKAQSVVYLTSMKPVKSLAYKPASEFLYDKIPMGGVNYTNGFGLWILDGPTKHGYVEYSLKGRYSKLSFILGTSPFHDPSKNKGVFMVTGDGNPLLDKVITANSVPERITLDVAGVDVLRFEIVTGGVTVGVTEATLWTSKQTPRKTGKLTNATKKVTALVADLKPYFVSNGHAEVGAEKKVKSLNLSGVEYTDGLRMNANMALIGNNRSWTEFNLGGMYKQMKMTFGPVKASGGTAGTAWLTVKSNNKVVAEYEIHEQDLAKEVVLDIAGCNQLTIESEQENGSSTIAVVDMKVYPEGSEPVLAQNQLGKEQKVQNNNLKQLPNVCKLISNIPPYALNGINDAEQKCLFNGKSQHITFSMGGTRFWEGIVLQSSTSLFNDNTRAQANFNLGGEFDYLSFTVGWVGKCGVLKNDSLRIYADDRIVLDMPLMGTAPNQHLIVPLYKCSKLTIEKRGLVSLDHPAFGVADMVVYRGEPVENKLFVHPKPETPDEIDLIDLGAPYIHYVKGLALNSPKFLDGSLKKEFFTLLNGERVNKGFLLSTSVHFDLEMGPLGGAGGGTGIVAGAIGSSVLVGAVGGAAITAVSPFGAFLALAAGGTAHESGCAAFNTYGEYDQVTFTVVNISKEKNNYEQKSTLLIGGDHEVLHEIELDIYAGPTTFTLPINKCHQLMFWLKCGKGNAPNYLFYDVKVTKGAAALAVTSAVGGQAVGGQAGLKAPIEPYGLPVKGAECKPIDWERPKTCNVKYIDEYFYESQQLKKKIDSFITSYKSHTSSATFVTGADGHNYRKVEISLDGKQCSIKEAMESIKQVMTKAKNLKREISTMKLSQANANLALVDLGLGGISMAKKVKAAGKMLGGYSKMLDAVIDDKNAEMEVCNALLRDAVYSTEFMTNETTIYVR